MMYAILNLSSPLPPNLTSAKLVSTSADSSGDVRSGQQQTDSHGNWSSMDKLLVKCGTVRVANGAREGRSGHNDR